MPHITRRHLLTAALALPAGVTARRAMAATHQVTIKGFKFSPATLSAAAGDTVTFTNGDSAPHTATAANGSFDTGTLRKGQSASIRITAGNHAYVCKFHPNMKGSIAAS